VFEKLFEPKRGPVTGGPRKSHNKELHNMFSLQNVIGDISTMTLYCQTVI
jgi:hypothetical protein